MANFLNKFWNLILICLFMGTSTIYAQRQRNYVYIFDCTKSMDEPNNIWQPAKEFLKNDLKQLDNNANVTVVLFHQDAAAPISFKAKDLNWNDLENKCDQLIKQSKYTGICKAWDKGLQFIDSTRNNYFYLFTDGKENVIKPKGTDAVCQRISQWCEKTSNNDYAFFVALPSKSLLNSPEIKKIQEAVKSCDRTYFISGPIAPFGSFDKTTFNQNCHSVRNIEVGFSDYGSFDAKVICDDPNYSISLKNGKVENGKAVFEIKKKKEPSNNYQVYFKVVADSKDMHICNPDMYINIDTRNLRNLDFAQPNGSDGEYDAGETETYSDFLFFSGKETNRILVDLGAKFSEQAQKESCSIDMSVKVPNGCKLFYNDNPIISSFSINSADAKSVLSIEIPHNLPEDNFYLDIKGTSSNLETINSEDTKTYSSKIHFIHNRSWHPIKTLLFWLSFIGIALLLLWFVVLKWIFYPRIRLSRIEFKCDELNYYENKRINSARKVVIGPKKYKQNWLNKLFTGKIVSIANPQVWLSEWEITPKGRSKSAKLHLRGRYHIQSISSEIQNFKEYKLKNVNNNISITIKTL